MLEVSLFYDSEKTKPVGKVLNFGVVEAGEVVAKHIYVQINIDSLIEVTLSVTGMNIELLDKNITLSHKGSGRVTFELSPKVTQLKPLSGQITIAIKYILK